MNSCFSLADRDLMMRFTGLGVGHLEHKARTVNKLVVEDEPNWSELCPTTPPGALDPAVPESESDSDSGGVSEEDPDDTPF